MEANEWRSCLQHSIKVAVNAVTSCGEVINTLLESFAL